jgi:hypothetical protein
VLENPQLFSRARAGAGVKSQNFRGRGRARGPNLKIFAGAGGRGGQIFSRGRARASAPPQAPARAPTRANLKIYNHFRNLNFGKKHYLILFLDKIIFLS